MNGYCRIYFFKADEVFTGEHFHTLGGNRGWTEIDSQEYHVKLKNLCAARNAQDKLAYCVFTSECLNGRTIDDVIRSLLGATYPPGLYEF